MLLSFEFFQDLLIFNFHVLCLLACASPPAKTWKKKEFFFYTFAFEKWWEIFLEGGLTWYAHFPRDFLPTTALLNLQQSSRSAIQPTIYLVNPEVSQPWRSIQRNEYHRNVLLLAMVDTNRRHTIEGNFGKNASKHSKTPNYTGYGFLGPSEFISWNTTNSKTFCF